MKSSSLHGHTRPDGSWIGYDYENQVWIDTDPMAVVDSAYPKGSANNPLATKPAESED